MGTVYSPVYSQRTGWILGRIVDHVAKPLTEDEVNQAAERLNELDAAPAPIAAALTPERLKVACDRAWALVKAGLVDRDEDMSVEIWRQLTAIDSSGRDSRVEDSPGPTPSSSAENGAATPGQAVKPAAGNVAVPQLAPGNVPASSPPPAPLSDTEVELACATARHVLEGGEVHRAPTIDEADTLAAFVLKASTLHEVEEWHEDIGTVLWWSLPIEEPPYCGTPGDDDWPGYHTHWSPLITPEQP